MASMDPAGRALVLDLDRLAAAAGLARGLGEHQDLPAVARADLGRLAPLHALNERADLRRVRGCVARLEIRPGIVRARRRRAELLDRRRREILGAQHALLAEHFDALVVAVDRAARVVDVAHLAGGGAQEE